MTTDGDPATREVSVELPQEFVDAELLPAYPAAGDADEAIRMAVQEAADRRRHLFEFDSEALPLEYLDYQRLSVGEGDE